MGMGCRDICSEKDELGLRYGCVRVAKCETAKRKQQNEGIMEQKLGSTYYTIGYESEGKKVKKVAG